MGRDPPVYQAGRQSRDPTLYVPGQDPTVDTTGRDPTTFIPGKEGKQNPDTGSVQSNINADKGSVRGMPKDDDDSIRSNSVCSTHEGDNVSSSRQDSTENTDLGACLAP